MLATGEDCKTDTGSRRGFILRWLAVGVVLLALGLASLSNAHAHSFQADPAGSIAAQQSESGPDSAHCCHAGEHENDRENCPALSHCGGCAVGGDRVAAPTLSPVSHPYNRLTTLPAGLVAGPAGHPPKAI